MLPLSEMKKKTTAMPVCTFHLQRFLVLLNCSQRVDFIISAHLKFSINSLIPSIHIMNIHRVRIRKRKLEESKRDDINDLTTMYYAICSMER